MTAQGFQVGETTVDLPAEKRAMLVAEGYEGMEIILGIRPEHIHTNAAEIESNASSMFEATIDVAELMGAETYLYAHLNGSNFIARIEATTAIKAGDKIPLAFDMEKAHFFDAESEKRIF